MSGWDGFTAKWLEMKARRDETAYKRIPGGLTCWMCGAKFANQHGLLVHTAKVHRLNAEKRERVKRFGQLLARQAKPSKAEEER